MPEAEQLDAPALEITPTVSMTIALAKPLLDELKTGAEEVELGLGDFVTEILQSFAASRRLPRVPCSAEAPKRRKERRRKSVSDDDIFPFPAETYGLNLPGHAHAE